MTVAVLPRAYSAPWAGSPSRSSAAGGDETGRAAETQPPARPPPTPLSQHAGRSSSCWQYSCATAFLLQCAVQAIGRELGKELVADTERLLALYDTLPTTNEIIPGSESVTCPRCIVITTTPGMCVPATVVKKTQLPVDQLLRAKLRPSDKVKGQSSV